MSETEIVTGKLIKVDINGSREEKCKAICEAEGFIKSTYNDSWYEQLCDDGYKQYVIHGDDVFKVERATEDPYADIFQAQENSDGTISFVVKYYNGACSFPEAIGYALRAVETNKPAGE